MKTKRSKKLTFNKETVVNLDSSQMEGVKGGLTFTDPRVCDTGGSCNIYQSWLYSCEGWKTCDYYCPDSVYVCETDVHDYCIDTHIPILP
jgi:hypothetical protein